MIEKTSNYTISKYAKLLLLVFYLTSSNAQERDTVLFIPKTKFQSKFLASKTDSINLLKKRAVLTAKTSKDLTKRIAELDSILNFYKKSAKDVIQNLARKDTIIPVKKVKLTNAQKRLAKRNAIMRRNDSLKLLKNKRLEARKLKRKRDSARIADNKLKVKFRNDSIRISKNINDVKRREDSTKLARLVFKERLRQDSLKVVSANVAAQKRRDSLIQVELFRKAQLKKDSIRIAIANIAAKKRRDSLNKLKLIRIAQLRKDSTRIANAKLTAQRKRDSILQLETYRIAQFKKDSIRIAKANILAKRRRDSLNQLDAIRRAQLRQDSIKIAKTNLSAQLKLDSIKQVESIRKAQYLQDSIRIARANINAKRRSDSIIQADINRKVKFIQDSIRIAKANIEAKKKIDAIKKAIELQNNSKRKQDSLRATLTRLSAADLAKRKQDSISNVINAILAKQRVRDSISAIEAKITAELLEKRRQDSIINAIAKSKVDDLFKNKDSSEIANNDNLNLNNNLNLLDSTAVPSNLIESNFINASQLVDSMPYVRTGNILSKFIKGEINLRQGQIVSNVLKVVNLGIDPIEFTTDLLIPGGWTRFDDATRTFTAKQNDTIIVPIIINPTKFANGNTEIIINSFIIGKEQQQLANNYFTLKTKKKVSWEIGLNSTQNVYLKNEEKNKRFNFQIRNTGNYKQDLFVNYRIPKSDIVLADTLGIPILKPNVTFTLEANQRKDFDMVALFKDSDKRNLKRISLNSYIPNKVQNRVSHGLIINTSEPRNISKLMQKRTRLNFVKLPNEIKANPYGYPYLPLTVRMSAQNLLSEQSFLSISLRGFKQLNKNASLLYSTNFNYNNSYFSNEIFKNAPWYVGYFDDKKTIEVGQISGGSIGSASSGKGVKGSYRINDQHLVGAYYVNSDGLFGTNSNIGFGLSHVFNYNDAFKLKTQISRNVNNYSNRTLNTISLIPSITIMKKHNIGITSALINKSQEVETPFFKSNGMLLGLNYGSHFFRKRLKVNYNVRFNDRNFGFGFYDRFFANQRVNFVINDKWSAYLSNSYQKSNRYSLYTGDVTYAQESSFNNLILSSKTNSGSYQPGLYYEYRSYPNSILFSRGALFRYSNFNYDNNFLNSIYLKAGYTKPTLHNTDDKDYFSFEFSSLTRYRTWSFNTRYNLGAFSTLTSQQNLNDFITPQSIRLSVQNQYMFPNRHLAVESNVVYSYNNVFSNHTLGIYPTAYYFTDSGWRFGLSANYSFSTRDYSSVYDNIDNQSGENFSNYQVNTNSNFNLNFSLKKDFGIPIPFVKKTAATANFIAFLDLNGNGIKDDEEATLENVVIKLDKKEVLTNFNGEAIVKNVLKDEYEIDAFSLEKLNGWFPNLERTVLVENDEPIYIPFVRGIKVYGDVVLDRQKIAVADQTPIDLSRIKISALKDEKVYSALTNTKGRFEFYLPVGEYVITMDEAILGDKLQISRNNIPLKLNSSQEGVYISFYVIEKRRKVIFTDFTKKKN